MIENTDITKEELDTFMNALSLLKEEMAEGGAIKSEQDFYQAFAKLPLETTRLKKLIVTFKDQAVPLIVNLLNDTLTIKEYPNKRELISRLNNNEKSAFIEILDTLKLGLIGNNDNNFEALNVAQLANLFNIEVRKYICLANACILSDFPDAANANIEIALLKLGQKLNLFKASDQIIQKEGEIKRAKDASKKSNQKRHAKTNLVKEYAIGLYEQGKFPSVRNASQRIAQQVMDYAHNDEALRQMEGTDKKFTDIFSAADTIERWIGKHNRSTK